MKKKKTIYIDEENLESNALIDVESENYSTLHKDELSSSEDSEEDEAEEKERK